VRAFAEKEPASSQGHKGGGHGNSCSSALGVYPFACAVIGIVGVLATIPYVTAHAFWIAVFAYIVLAAGVL
jgi:hypothetical protein